MKYVKCSRCDHVFGVHIGGCPQCPNCGYKECGEFEEVDKRRV